MRLFCVRYSIMLLFVYRLYLPCPTSLLLLFSISSIDLASAIAPLLAAPSDNRLLCLNPLYNTSSAIATMTSDELISSLYPPNDLIDSILQVRGPFRDDDEEAMCKVCCK